MDWSIQEVARLAGTTSRTLRHYDAIGLLHPLGTGPNGYRRYGPDELLRLQRILLLRELGLGLPQIAAVLDRVATPAAALAAHGEWLRQERARIGRQLASVERTLERLERGEPLMASEMFDGFDPHRHEVTARWGADAYTAGEEWWRGMDAAERAQWRERVDVLARDWSDAAARGIPADSDEAQELAARQVAWLRGVPGTPAADPAGDIAGYITGLGEMYVVDGRFARHYGGEEGARFVRDALRAYAEREL
ncbi:MAG: TipAS antibiotic-recognition domain-containing protein [Microbacterium sp.]|uniref:MerR family transcriptional regulator n=1 Tax=Microbacterium sp. TaxID=51671 RepID=UPI0039E5F985